MTMPRNADHTKIEKWHSKVCRLYGQGKIPSRLFRKFDAQYQAYADKFRSKLK